MATEASQNLTSRPIANFHPCRWGEHFLNFVPDDEEQEVVQLKEEVKQKLLATANKPLEQLNLIDVVERLGVAYHFEKEIEGALQQIYHNYDDQCEKDDVYHVSVRFRILRQHGFYVSCAVFEKFVDANGSFKESMIKDVPGMLSLYEASHVRVRTDVILDKALAFTSTHLSSMANQLSSPLKEQVAHALCQPLQKGMIRLESKLYIYIYEQNPSHDETLLKLAKLDFNLLQSLHKKELSELARWWKGLHVKLPFSRDRSTEVQFWMVGAYYEPQDSQARKIFSKMFKLISLIDDTYDAYGTLYELELLTEAIQRWNTSSIDQLPDHVKWSYKVLLKTFKEVEDELAQEGKSHRVYYAREQFKIYCKALLQEAKWCNEKHVPTYEEYMKVGLWTSALPFGIVAAFLGMVDCVTKEALEWVCQNPMPNELEAASKIIRLLNDMGGHKFEQSRNHVASSVQCQTVRHGKPSEEHAHEELKKEVVEGWKVLNMAMLQPCAIPEPMMARVLNLVRASEVIYNGEDGYTQVSQAMKENVAAVLVDGFTI